MAFSFRVGTNWCHDFPKLARDSGFYFNMHGSRVRVDWNRISAIDIDRVMRERDFSTIDENINNVIDYCLENEYDVKILDSNFVKLFRLAQLSVEYLLYCKQYLDHSVIILKDELRLKIEQNVGMKKEITTLEETIRNLKEKSKERSNKLIEARIGDSTGEIYKCPHCPKTFVSALFVNAHVARRHLYISDTSTSPPMHEHYRAETEKLHNEIKTLKERLNQTERVIMNESDKLLGNTDRNYIRNMSKNEYKVVTTDSKQEQKKYEEDISSLKNMLFNEIRALKEKEQNINESILEANVKTFISQQEKEIESLRSQLLERLTPSIENMQVKLQTQEDYWKAKLEDMEAQHHRDIEKLTTELKVTQQATDRTKTEYASKVHDLERLSMNQSNMLVEQGKQLNSLSREISNSQIQNNDKTGEKVVEKFYESPVLEIKRDNMGDNESYRKNLSSTVNGEMVIKDIESSREYSDTSNNKDVANSRDIRRSIINLGRIAERAKSNSKNLQRLETIRRTRDKAKYDISREMDETQNHSNRSFSSKDSEDFPKKHNVGRIRILHMDDIRNSEKSEEFLEKHSVSSTTESSSDNVTINDDDDITTMKQYEMKIVVQSPDIRSSLQKNARNMFDNRLKDLGIDPEWQGIPAATFKQKMDIVKHQQNINAKKLAQYNRIKQKILENVLRRISGQTVNMKSPLHKLVTHVRSKAVKALSSHIDSDEYVRGTGNTSKLHLKQKIELLPRKYKDEETFEDTTNPLIRNRPDIYTSPKVTQPRLIANRYRSAYRNISSAESSLESSPKNIRKQISCTKITVLDNSARKIDSPIGRKERKISEASSKLPSEYESDSTNIVVQHEDSVVSPKNNKSVLKSTSGSVSSLIKKKVIFDLEDGETTTLLGNNPVKESQVNNSDWNNISNFFETRNCILQKEKSMSTGSIILKTSQSDKIAEISKKIQEQLSIVRKPPPVGSVETIFRSNWQDLTDYSAENQLLNSTSLPNTIAESPVKSFTSPKMKNNTLFSQLIPQTLKDKDLIVVQRKNELSSLKHSDLDSDIDEILQME
ncbi:PREDICTED: zinc finger protein Dzip1 isoform X2 [Dinoponera quadriceps]|uniref:Zinc finger protein Dzip1 isoform X2 n=2 Tax=Dinoponera quadriceps TaxID=609295 RepID=A0A6P3X1N3_DINQU|nr:PREDICTED: zinc finger protein Dzip1 isoform X2 [Dinoponera quadriceps]XP_014472282.1 PREDICTED: zinc finger protein Dzip1 isoform X2 [Dinoponera quadriceps]XP_014472283.1 PREDICTED: zinc finger protein Dzip1 isoform X2 [Dinoponera quadriceps]